MPEERRVEKPAVREMADRDSRTEQLLVEGLDRYFAGAYEDAIHVWTRVLFLDRSHARARAYIDRARTALAERQRRAEELLETTGDLLATGDTRTARALLSQAVAATGEDERAAALRFLLERAERAGGVQTPGGAGARPARLAAPATVTVTDRMPGRRRRWRWYALAVGAAVIAGAALSWPGWRRAPAPARPGRVSVELPMLSLSEAALVRARTLYARGRLAEALQTLDRIDPHSTERTAADRLRLEIQQVLLAVSRGTRRPTAPETAGVR